MKRIYSPSFISLTIPSSLIKATTDTEAKNYHVHSRSSLLLNDGIVKGVKDSCTTVPLRDYFNNCVV